MRVAYRVWSGIAAATFVVVAAVDLTGSGDSSSSTTTAVPSAVSADRAYSPGVPYSSSGSSGSSVDPSTAGSSVVRVVDGDTFELSNGRSVRVLGIDSCEANTSGGVSAAADATDFLSSGSITLGQEPGVDTDPYGRLLRYVSTSTGGDMGEHMVRSSHTEVYRGGNDASAPRLATLRSLDDGPRTCGGSPTTSTEPTSEPDEDQRRPYVPAPDPVDTSGEASSSGSSSDDDDDGGGTKPRTGNSGHPCLPGERDGDDDGYCGEGR